jgi:hypothetical protein
MPPGHDNVNGCCEEPEGITFSLENGIVLASWSCTDEIVPLGPLEAVTAMMEDFLAQNRFAAKLMDSVSSLKDAEGEGAEPDSTES